MEIRYTIFTFCVMVISYFPECFSKTMQCNVTDVTRCGMMMSRLADQSGDTTKSCKAAADIMVCLSPYEEPCSSNKQSMGYGIYNQLVAHVSSLKTLCKCLPLVKCTQMLASGTTPSQGDDMAEMCSKYENVKICIEPHKDKCINDTNMQQIMQSLTNMERYMYCIEEIDLLAAIGVPSQTPGISYTSGIDGYPAFRILDSAYIRVAAQALLKDRLYDNFALTLTLLSGKKSGGMLFAVKDPAEALVQFGLELTPVNSANKQELVLYWTQNPRIAQRTVQIATFKIDSITQKWTKLGLKVENNRISLYVNCKLEDTKTYDRGSNVLVMELGSSLYIADGGPNFKRKFTGALQEMKMFNDVNEAENMYCDDYVIGSGSGSGELEPPIGVPSLKGEKGERGEQGMKGDQGEKGNIVPPGCDLGKLQICLNDMKEVRNLDGIYANVDTICSKVQSYQQCSQPEIEKCLEKQEQCFGMVKKQAEMVNQMTDLLCVQERQALKQMGTCFNKSDVAVEMEKCGKLTTPSTNEDGEFEEEVSEAVQCERMSKFEDCLDVSLKDPCGADAARVAIRVGRSMMRIMYDAKDLECPGDASNRLESGLLILLLALVASIVF